MAVRVEAGQRSEDSACCVRDEDRMVVVAHGAVVGQEVEQVGHLLEVGGHPGAVGGEVGVVEDDRDDVLDAVVQRTALGLVCRAGCLMRRCGGGDQNLHRHERSHGCELDQPSHTNPPTC